MNGVTYLNVEDALGLIRRLGIGPVRDIGLLESALLRPAARPFGEEAYPSLGFKAAALLDSLAHNHSLVDGSKRLAWLAVVVFVDLNGHRVNLNDDAAFQLVWDVASSHTAVEEIAARLRLRRK